MAGRKNSVPRISMSKNDATNGGVDKVSCWTKINDPTTEGNFFFFNVHGSVHRKNILIYIRQDATLHSL